ncbi:ATP12 family chaperone protein [Hyphomicrobium facile]|uniref:Chaperone required for the assembly of the F1-ATPase n=1 Tax=Hyphomicrobium facile TaxID=51670 RepID=A0A1I7NCK5_9HYPH|nr:ATP12 family protein [Hyphomicrobium facile]SFV32400.1 Chaperone required for the assembly of the F1-ATPase [Hyphomicrobium facile]
MSTGNGKGDAGGASADRASGGPRSAITDSLKKPLPKRFYKEVSVGDVAPFQVLLDGRAIKTPKKRQLALPTRALAEAIAAEWRAQAEVIDPAKMPLTRFANTAIDAVADTLEAVAADITAYAGSDLVCYRAKMPPKLVESQSEHWDPIVAWANTTLPAHFEVVAGVVHVAQPEASLAAFSKALPHDAFRLTALHVLTTLTGSALITLAVFRQWLSPDAAWKAAHVDEDYQISVWGEDAEASARRRGRKAEFDSANRFLELTASAS